MQAPPSRGKRSPSPSLPAFPLEVPIRARAAAFALTVFGQEGYSQAEVPRREASSTQPRTRNCIPPKKKVETGGDVLRILSHAEAANSPPLPAAGGARVARTPPLSGMASARSVARKILRGQIRFLRDPAMRESRAGKSLVFAGSSVIAW